jgi:DNA modification methylase
MIYYKNEQMIIYNDDSLEKIKVFKPNHFDAVITDPPYSFGLASFSGVGNNKVSKWGDLLNQSYFFRELINNAKRCLKKNGVIWLFANWRMLPVLMKGTIEANESIESVLIWDKDWIGPGGSKGLRPSYEIVVLICPGDKGILNRGIRDIVTVPWSSNKKYHPAEKPVGLLEHLVKISTL